MEPNGNIGPYLPLLSRSLRCCHPLPYAQMISLVSIRPIPLPLAKGHPHISNPLETALQPISLVQSKLYLLSFCNSSYWNLEDMNCSRKLQNHFLSESLAFLVLALTVSCASCAGGFPINHKTRNVQRLGDVDNHNYLFFV